MLFDGTGSLDSENEKYEVDENETDVFDVLGE